jgi:PAS domain S-box-containing protein
VPKESNKKAGADQGVEDSRALLAAIVASSQDAILSRTLEGIITSWNTAAERMFGYKPDEVIGQHISILIPKERLGEEDYIIGCVRRGERVEHYETIRQRKDGSPIDISLTISPILNSKGKIIGASKIARDVSDRKVHEQTQRELAREVNHRSKNLLAVVQSIVRQTARNTPPEEVVERVMQRLQALSINQDMLIARDWSGIGLQQLVDQHLRLNPNVKINRVDITGTDIKLRPVAAQALGLALHELFSNAVRFGALKGDDGRVAVSWTIKIDGGKKIFAFEWRESGGPVIAAPERMGFGHTILSQATGQSLGGTVQQSFDPSGYSWVLTAPADLALAD